LLERVRVNTARKKELAGKISEVQKVSRKELIMKFNQ
jgi:hypothetical protein